MGSAVASRRSYPPTGLNVARTFFDFCSLAARLNPEARGRVNPGPSHWNASKNALRRQGSADVDQDSGVVKRRCARLEGDADLASDYSQY
jgi:hypothetical protein